MCLSHNIRRRRYANTYYQHIAPLFCNVIPKESSGNNKENTSAGFVAVLAASVLSGFAGVYFEKILKGSQTTLWVRNIQMGIPSIILSLVGVVTSAVLF